MLAAGLASGSRAGAILLLAEAGVILGLISGRRTAAKFVMWTTLLAAVAGAGTLAGTLRGKRSVALPARDYGVHFESDRGPSLARLRARHLRLCLSGLRNFRYRRGSRARAHNQWLEWAAEGGIPLALVWLTLAVGMSARAVRSIWGIGILAAFLHALVDYPFARFGLTTWDFTLIGALSAAAVRKAEPIAH